MKGIYLTEEGKQELEVKIIELEEFKKLAKEDYDWNEIVVEQNVYKRMLQSATILPVYSDWEDIETFPPDNESQNKKYLELKNGVIIQSK
jgi:hypothetical protein